MNRTTTLFFAVVVLFAATHRLPAPISEIAQPTPTPKAKPKEIDKPRPLAKSTLAGTWTGATFNKCSNGQTGTVAYIIKISDDEKAVLLTCNQVTYPATCSRFRETLTWSLKQITPQPTWVCTDQIRLNTNGTASFAREVSCIDGEHRGTSC